MAMQAVGRAAFDNDRRSAPAVQGDSRADGRHGGGRLRALRRHLDPGVRSVRDGGVPGVALAVRAGRRRFLLFGPAALGGLLAGVTSSGVMMAIFRPTLAAPGTTPRSTSRAGNHGGKGSDAHKASVVGDTVGDPFKDTSGPSLNILIKLMSVVALVIAPLL